MITQDYFLKKISELAHMRCLLISPNIAKDVFPKFQEFDAKDLNQAIDAEMMEEGRFDFVKLRRRLINSRSVRLETESNFNRIQEGKDAERFFKEEAYEGECTRQKCQGCGHLKNCKVRGREWIKSINSIWNFRGPCRPPGEGKKMAEEAIHYMNHEFMGGIR
jgi:hypothetical protein